MEEADRGVEQIPRRVGFFVRWRARTGLLPGQVSTAALVQARPFRWGLFVFVPFVVISLIIVFAVGSSSNTADRDARVANLQDLDRSVGSGARRWGRAVFDEHLALEPGDRVSERFRYSRAIRLVVDGRYVPSTNDRNSSSGRAVVFFVAWAALVGLFVGPTMVWGRRTYKTISGDLGAPTLTATGT